MIEKKCPFINRECMKDECMFYESKLNAANPNTKICTFIQQRQLLNSIDDERKNKR